MSRHVFTRNLRSVAIVFAAMGVLATPCSVLAALVIQPESVTFPVGTTTGWLDVYAVTGGDVLNFNGTNFELTVEGPLVVHGIGDFPTEASSAHPPWTPTGYYDRTDSSTTSDQIADYFAYEKTKEDGHTLVDGGGIIRVPFNIPAGTVGTFNVDLQVFLASDNTGTDPLPATGGHGTITITPEPSALVLAVSAAGCIAVLGAARRRRRA
jgi:hypothetical protein